MLCKDSYGEEIFIGTFTNAIKVPSGAAGINFGSRTDFNIETLILEMSFKDFVIAWNRTH